MSKLKTVGQKRPGVSADNQSGIWTDYGARPDYKGKHRKAKTTNRQKPRKR